MVFSIASISLHINVMQHYALYLGKYINLAGETGTKEAQTVPITSKPIYLNGLLPLQTAMRYVQ
jgi:hypothetical protein